MRNKEIAYQIGTTEQVIKNYLRKVYDKLGVSDRLELALYCLHHPYWKERHRRFAGGSDCGWQVIDSFDNAANRVFSAILGDF